MERLPDEQREVVALILVEGFGYREAAEMLGAADRHGVEPAGARPDRAAGNGG